MKLKLLKTGRTAPAPKREQRARRWKAPVPERTERRIAYAYLSFLLEAWLLSIC